jgi:hypothetical protein
MKIAVRLLIVLVALGVFFYLFIRSARSVRSETYVVPAAHLTPWTLAIGEGLQATSPILELRPPRAFGSELFGQIFSRMMESMKGSMGSGIPIVLRGEFDRALAGRYSPASLLERARAAGLESSSPEPVCVAVRRISAPGVTRQLYYVMFHAPAIREFRSQLAAEAAATFAPSDQSPILIVAASDDQFDAWLPLTASTDAECVAPIAVE